ncbi:MAG: ABC transporter ATP-binding protein [Bacteroidia bacterium]
MIHLSKLSKNYPLSGGQSFLALDQLDLRIEQGQSVAIVGKSGSGKSTLLNLLSGIDRPSSGAIHIDNQSINELPEKQMAKWRGQRIGIIFQFFQLISTLTTLENLLLAMDFVNKIPKGEREKRALDLLTQVDIEEQAAKFPQALSGGQQQRVAIARAMANDPDIILADEPTGNLDSQTTAEIMQLFARLRELGKTVIMVTHDVEAAQNAERIIRLKDGRIESDTFQNNHTDA